MPGSQQPFGYNDKEIKKNPVVVEEKLNDNQISSPQEKKEAVQVTNSKIKNVSFNLNLDETDESEVYDYISKMPNEKLGFVITQALLAYKENIKIGSMFEVVQNLSSFLSHLSPNQTSVQVVQASPAVAEVRAEKPKPVTAKPPKEPEIQKAPDPELVLKEEQSPGPDLNLNPDDLFKNIFDQSKKF